MFTLINSLPWYLWFLVGIIGAPYLLWWVIKSTKNDPILFRVSWGMMAIAGIYVAIDSFAKGMGLYFGSLEIMKILSLPIAVLIMTLMAIGGYQKVMRPGYDPEKRRMFIICMYLMVGAIIFLGLAILAAIYHKSR
jgi:hypothetical protein